MPLTHPKEFLKNRFGASYYSRTEVGYPKEVIVVKKFGKK